VVQTDVIGWTISESRLCARASSGERGAAGGKLGVAAIVREVSTGDVVAGAGAEGAAPWALAMSGVMESPQACIFRECQCAAALVTVSQVASTHLQFVIGLG
jgi:hypothetical protein